MSKLICTNSNKAKNFKLEPTYSIKDGVKMTTDWYHKVYKEKK